MCWAEEASAARLRKSAPFAKTLTAVSGRVSGAVKHLIPEVRPQPGQRVTVFNNAYGVLSVVRDALRQMQTPGTLRL